MTIGQRGPFCCCLPKTAAELPIPSMVPVAHSVCQGAGSRGDEPPEKFRYILKQFSQATQWQVTKERGNFSVNFPSLVRCVH